MSQKGYVEMVRKLAEIKHISMREAALIILQAVSDFYTERNLKCQ
jgi:hypothetical protein